MISASISANSNLLMEPAQCLMFRLDKRLSIYNPQSILRLTNISTIEFVACKIVTQDETLFTIKPDIFVLGPGQYKYVKIELTKMPSSLSPDEINGIKVNRHPFGQGCKENICVYSADCNKDLENASVKRIKKYLSDISQQLITVSTLACQYLDLPSGQSVPQSVGHDSNSKALSVEMIAAHLDKKDSMVLPVSKEPVLAIAASKDVVLMESAPKEPLTKVPSHTQEVYTMEHEERKPVHVEDDSIDDESKAQQEQTQMTFNMDYNVVQLEQSIRVETEADIILNCEHNGTICVENPNWEHDSECNIDFDTQSTTTNDKNTEMVSPTSTYNDAHTTKKFQISPKLEGKSGTRMPPIPRNLLQSDNIDAHLLQNNMNGGEGSSSKFPCIVIPDKVLKFCVPGRRSSASPVISNSTILLKNTSQTYCYAYKIKTNNHYGFSINPSRGLIGASSMQSISVLMCQRKGEVLEAVKREAHDCIAITMVPISLSFYNKVVHLNEMKLKHCLPTIFKAASTHLHYRTLRCAVIDAEQSGGAMYI